MNLNVKSSLHERETMENSNASRTPKRRTKSGCLTCRKRRIKCGEEKPACRNCTKTRRNCEQPPPSTAGRGSSNRYTKRETRSQIEQVAENLRSSTAQLRSFPELWKSDLSGATPEVYPISYASSQDSSLSPGLSFRTDSHSPQDLQGVTFDYRRDQNLVSEEMYNGSMIGGGESSDLALSTSLPHESVFFPVDPLLSPPIHLNSGGDVDYFPAINAGQYTSMMRGPAAGLELFVNPPQIQSNGRQAKQPELAIPRSGVLTPRDLSSVPIAIEGIKTASARTRKSSSHVRQSEAPSRLTDVQHSLFEHFMHAVNLSFTTLLEQPSDKRQLGRVQQSNFWKSVIPGMALTSFSLLHALLAISALHQSNISNGSEHEALDYYRQSARRLQQELQDPRAFKKNDLIAATLILACFEVFTGQAVRGGNQHLPIACNLVRRLILLQHRASPEAEKYGPKAQSTTSSQLIWFYIHEDVKQAALSNNGLWLELEYIRMCPVRGEAGSITHVSDELRIFLAHIGDFAYRDRLRKETNPHDPLLLERSTTQWNELMERLLVWVADLPTYFQATAVQQTATPFGEPLTYLHPTIAACQIRSLAAMLVLHRSHPTTPADRFEAARATADSTHALTLDIVRILNGIMVEAVNNHSVENGLHIQAIIDARLPIELAGVAIRDFDQREYLQRMLQDVYTFTGWQDILQVLQTLELSWQSVEMTGMSFPVAEEAFALPGDFPPSHLSMSKSQDTALNGNLFNPTGSLLDEKHYRLEHQQVEDDPNLDVRLPPSGALYYDQPSLDSFGHFRPGQPSMLDAWNSQPIL